MQNQKYHHVRNELDKLKITEHLGEDSIDLVDRMIKEYKKLFQTFMKLKRRVDAKSEPGLENLQDQFNLLSENYSNAKSENERLKKQLDQGGISEKIKTLESALNSCRLKYQKQLDEMRDKLSANDIKIEDLSYSKNSLTEENQRIRNILERSKQETDNSSHELTSLLEKKKKDIVKLEEQNSKYRLQISSLQRLYQQEKQKWSQNQNQSSKQTSGVLQVLREQLAQTQGKLEQCKSQLYEEHEKNRQLSEKIRNLTDQLSNLRHNEDYTKNSISIEQNAKYKLQSLLKQCQQKNNNFKEKIMNLEKIQENNQQEINRQTNKIKDLSNKNTNLMNNINRIQDQIGVLNTNFTQKVRELRESQNKKITLEKRIKDMEVQFQEFKSSSSTSNNQSSSLSKGEREQFEKKQIIYEKQIQMVQTQLKVMQQNENKILGQKNKLQVEIKKLQLIINQGNKQLEIIRTQKQNLMKQNKELKSHLNSTQSQGYTSKSESMRLKQTLEEYEIMIQDLKVSIRNQQNVNKSHAQKVSELEKEIEQKNNANKKMFDDNKQLQMLVSSLEKTKGELFEKYKMSAQEKSMSENMSLEQRKEYSLLLDERKELMEKLRNKEMAVSSLSLEYDQLQNQLDTITEDNYSMKKHIDKLQKQRQKFGKGLGQRQMNIQGMSIKIKTLQDSLEKYQRNYHSKCDQLNQACIEIDKRRLQVQQYKNQINLLVMSNKQLQKNNQRLKMAKIDIEKKLKDRVKQIDEERENAGAYKIENQNLRGQLKSEKEELLHLKNYVQEITDEYNNVYNILTKRDCELKEFDEACRQLQYKENQNMSEITHLEREIRQLGDQLIRRDEEIQRLVQDRDLYRTEVSSSRRSYSNGSDWKGILEQKIRSLESQLAIKRRECQNFRFQIRKHEKIIQEERQKNYQLEDEIKRSKIIEGSQTPIKMFYKSRVESQNWNGYNREEEDLQQSLISEKKFQKNNINNSSSRLIGESFESQRSISSKQCCERLKQIDKQYNETLMMHKKK